MTTSQNLSLMLTVREAASALRVSVTTFYGLISSGQIRTIKIGKSRRVKRAEIEAFIERGAQ